MLLQIALSRTHISMPGNATKLIHGGDKLIRVPDVVPPINVSTTYAYPDDLSLFVKAADVTKVWGERPVYSRLSHPNSELVEQSISERVGSYVVAYSSGLSAFNALMTHFNPKVLAIGHGYHGVTGIADIWTRNHGLKQITLEDDFSKLGKGDLVHVETPINPLGTVYDLETLAAKAHERGAILSVDATFAPPPLLDPFKHGADIVMHSATKYFGGHSDLLAGLLFVKDAATRDQLVLDRIFLGTNIANLESSLLLRSLKTYELRVSRQSESATAIVAHLAANIDKFPHLKKIYHGLLQKDDFVARQQTGHSPVFAIEVDTEEFAKRLPGKLKYFYHATSLGGVESLIEWRALSDDTCSPTLLRVSIGVEDVEDLIRDLEAALL